MAIESKRGHEYPEASETWDRTFPQGTVHFYFHPEGFEYQERGETVKAPACIGFKVTKDGQEHGDYAPMPREGMTRTEIEQYFRETINGLLIPERRDAVVEMRPLEVKLTDGLEGDRSSCCLEPAVETAQENESALAWTCTKCGKGCRLLTEAEKLEVNKNAIDAINGLMAHPVKVIVIHKPSNKHAAEVVNLPDVRLYAKAVVESFPDDNYLDHFVVVEIDGDDVRVSELDV